MKKSGLKAKSWPRTMLRVGTLLLLIAPVLSGHNRVIFNGPRLSRRRATGIGVSLVTSMVMGSPILLSDIGAVGWEGIAAQSGELQTQRD